MKARLVGAILLAAVVLAVIGATAVTLLSETATPVEAARCLCPRIHAPVECDNGRTYPNQCVADCRNASGCVPVGL